MYSISCNIYKVETLFTNTYWFLESTNWVQVNTIPYLCHMWCSYISFLDAPLAEWKIWYFPISPHCWQGSPSPIHKGNKDVDSSWWLGICLPPSFQGVFILQHRNTAGLNRVDVPSCCTQLSQFGWHCCEPTLQVYARENKQVDMVRKRAGGAREFMSL